MSAYTSYGDDSYINVNLNTEMELPSSRDTVLHFFDRIRKSYPSMSNFYCRENGDFVLEEDKERGSYRWISLEPRRLCSGHVNPEEPEAAFKQHELVLELAPYHLSISSLDCDAIDLLFGFDFIYAGNHDELVAEALGVTRALESMLEMPGTRLLNYEPTITLSLDDSLRLQCRLAIETRTSAYQIRTGDFHEDQISLYFTVRQYWGFEPDKSFVDSLKRQRNVGEEILQEHVIPNVVVPLAEAISARQ